MPAPDPFRVLSVAPHLRVVPLPDAAGLVLIGESQHLRLPAGEVSAVLQALDGESDVDSVLAAVAEQVAPARALAILSQLLEQRLLCEVEPGAAVARAFESGHGLGPAQTVALRSLLSEACSEAAAEPALRQALQGAELRLDASAATVILLADDYLQPDLRQTTRELLAAGRRCFWLKPSGLRPLLGPLFMADPSQACPGCLCQLLAEQRPVESFLQLDPAVASGRPPRAALPASLSAACSLAALQLRRLLSSPEAQAAVVLWTLDPTRLTLAAHPVRRRPQCADCGDPDWMRRAGEQPVVLRQAPIAYDLDGGLRIEPPAKSYARSAHLVSDLLGPATHLEPMPGVASEVPLVWSAGYRLRPAELRPDEVFYRRCAGKGSTVEQARMSALSECIERYAGVYRGDEAVYLASYAELGEAALHPDALQLFSAAQQAAGQGAPPPLPPDERLAFTPAWSLPLGARRYLPLPYCYSEVPLALGAAYFRPSSNGSAAGNCLEEAILQGLFEAIERDAVAIWWYCRLRRPAAQVPPELQASFQREQAELARLGWSLWLLDLTHDLQVPVVVAVGRRLDDDRLALGFGCHSLPDLALRRAVSELHQVVLPPQPVRTPWHGLLASVLPFLFPDATAPRQPALPPPESRDLRVHVLELGERLRRCGLELYVVDKSRADLPLRVAQVIVPGLRHAWPRFAPGRLYSVPVALGWLPAPLAEADLNPAALLI